MVQVVKWGLEKKNKVNFDDISPPVVLVQCTSYATEFVSQFPLVYKCGEAVCRIKNFVVTEVCPFWKMGSEEDCKIIL